MTLTTTDPRCNNESCHIRWQCERFVSVVANGLVYVTPFDHNDCQLFIQTDHEYENERENHSNTAS